MVEAARSITVSPILAPVRFSRTLLILCCSSAFGGDVPLETSPWQPEVASPFVSDDGPWLERDLWSPPSDNASPTEPIDGPGPVDTAIPSPLIVEEPACGPGVPAGWLGALTDDNSLLFRETRNDTSFISHRGGFGLTSLGVVTGFQVGSSGTLAVQPRFGWHFLHGPLNPDLPPQLYDLVLEVNFARQIDEVWALHLQVAPTIATDFDNKDSDAFRLVSGGMLTARIGPCCKLVGGLTYLDRHDLPVVPVAGVRLQFGDVAADILIPSPRLAYRYDVDKEGTSRWVYVGGELAAGAWAYEQEDTGTHDMVGYRDFRFTLGHESRSPDGINSFLEAGYVFERHLDFKRTAPDFSPGNSWGMRIGIVF